MATAAEWVEWLSLLPHPEGGYYRETYRSSGCLPGSPGEGFPAGRSHATAIYFLLEAGDFSAFHRIKSDELWHHYDGDGLRVHVIGSDGSYRCLKLGKDAAAGETPQAVVPAGCWFASEPVEQGRYALVGCTVAPGFDFADFELADGVELSTAYPHHAELVRRLTRSSE